MSGNKRFALELSGDDLAVVLCLLRNATVEPVAGEPFRQNARRVLGVVLRQADAQAEAQCPHGAVVDVMSDDGKQPCAACGRWV